MKKYLFFFQFMAASLFLTSVLCATSYEKNSLDQKKFRAFIYKQTQEACLKGYTCTPHTAAYKLDPNDFKKMQKGTLLHTVLPPLKSPGPFQKTEVKVYKTGSLETSQQLKEKGYHPVVLNFANKSHVGGGVERGALAQEEDLFRRSSYFLGLDIKHNPYLDKQMHGKYLIPEFGAIYTPHVHIIRGPEREGFPFIPPFPLDFIACAAYNLNPNDHDAPKSEKDYREGMKKKLRTILRLGASTHHDAIVLGAFGCGAFKNNPKIVAPLFREVLHEPEFTGQYKLIAFAVPESGSVNHTVFRDCLDGMVLNVQK